MLRQAIGIGADRAAPHAELGRVLGEDGRVDEAIAEFQRAVELAPNNVWHYLGLGEAYQARGDVDKATDAFRHALELDPDNGIALKALQRLEP